MSREIFLYPWAEAFELDLCAKLGGLSLSWKGNRAEEQTGVGCEDCAPAEGGEAELKPRGCSFPGSSHGCVTRPGGWRLSARRSATRSRDELTDAETYHASESITVDRPHGAPAFGAREVTLMKLLHDEIAPLIGVRLATEEHLSRDGFSRRLRETLSLLLEGQSEKEVAAAMHIGTRTVHDHVMALYEHFQVSSRAELLAYFIRRMPRARTAGNGQALRGS